MGRWCRVLVDEITFPGTAVLLGMDDHAPLIRWRLSSATPGDAQTGWEVQVGTTLGGSDVAATGKQTGAVQQWRLRARLASATAYFVRVRVWDAADVASAWAEVSFETGLLAWADWQGAQWIGGADTDVAPLLRRTVDLTGVTRARLYVAAAGLADVQINGDPVSAVRVLEPGYTVFDKRVQYATHDVTGLLVDGTTTIEVTLGRGWYGVTTPTDWNWDTAPWHGQPRMLVMLVADTAEGTVTVISDGAWETRGSQTLADSVYLGETIDTRVDTSTGWAPAVVLPAPATAVVAMRQPPIIRHTPISPVAQQTLSGGRTVYDFGVNTAGWARAELAGPTGTVVTFTYGEKLKADGTPNVDNAAVTGQMQTDTVILNGSTVHYEPRFSYKGFRFVMVTGAVPVSIEAVPVHTDQPDTATFTCSVPLITQLAGMAAQSMRINAHGIVTDTPTHEKIGWLGDSNVTHRSQALQFGDANHALMRKWLSDMADSLTDTDRMPVIIPTSGWYADAVSPEWSSAFVLIAHRLWKLTGDRSVIGQHFDQMRRYVDRWLADPARTVWSSVFGDWAPPGGSAAEINGGTDYTATLFVILQTEAFADICDELGVSSTGYRARASSLRAAYADRLFDGVDTFLPAEGHAGGYRQGPNVLALAHGLVPAGKETAVADRLAADVTAQGGRLDVGILSEEHILQVLADNGHLAEAYEILTATAYPSWGQWADEGASTVWNSWGDLSAQRTLSHHMHGSFLTFLYEYLAGIRQVGPGVVDITPHHPAGLDSVQATVTTAHGPVTVAWDATEVTITTPPGVTATYQGTPVPSGVTVFPR